MTATLDSPASVEEALASLAEGARPVAGGTDLVVGARQGKAPLPAHLVAIHRLDGLRGIEAGRDGLVIGALASHVTIVVHSDICSRFSALADASAIVGSHATRAQGTIGGNLMNASPAMESGGPLICLGASAVLRSETETRRVSVEELLVSPGVTVARPDELLVAVEIPAPAAGIGSCYVRLEYRRQMEIAVVGVTAAVTLDNDRVVGARIAITALAPTIRRVPEAEAELVDSGSIDLAAASVRDAVRPISDVRASEEYRRAMAEVIARRAIDGAIRRARGETVEIPASALGDRLGATR